MSSPSLASVPEGAFHRVGFRLLDGRFMGQAQIGIDAMAGAGALADQQAVDASRNGDAHPGDVGDTPAAFLLSARAPGADQPFGLCDAAGEEGLALPAVKTKDAVGLADQHPALEVVDLGAALLPGGHQGAIEGSREGCDLGSAERCRRGRIGLACGSGGEHGRRGRGGWLGGWCGI